MSEKQNGTIKFLGSRGFGFILPEGGNADDKGIFFHKTNVLDNKFDDLREGQQVEYIIEETDKGPQAISVA